MGVLSKFGVPDGSPGSTHTLMPKLQYRFRVTFGNLGGDGVDQAVLTRQVISVTRPQLTHDEMILDVYNSRIYLAGKHVWNPITIILRDDVSNKAIKVVDQQLQNQLNHATQSGAKSGAQYKFDMGIETLAGDHEPTVLDFWFLDGCYISDIQYGDSNYATSDVQQITMTVRFDNAAHGKDGMPSNGNFTGDSNYLAQGVKTSGSDVAATDN